MTTLQFRFDPKRCTGCEACVAACWMENRAQQSQPWRRVHTFNGMHHPALPGFHLSLACHHCDDPACLENCPANAYTQDPDTGAVLLHAERCMGCRYCTWACPHDAPRYDEARGTVEKCTFCASRLEQGLEPACAARCPVEALAVERRTSYKGLTPPGFPLSDLGPGIRFVPGLRPPPVLTAPPPQGALAVHLKALLGVPQSKITLRGEWTLVAFTSTLAVLVGLMVAAASGLPVGRPGLFLGAGLAALALSAWHLGSPLRAWRSLSNLRGSWLSREIALVNAFMALSAAALLAPSHHRVLAWAAALVGLAALYAVDRVYQVAMKVGPLNFHSAHALFNGLYLAGLLARWWPLALGAGLLKTALYLYRKRHFARQGKGGPRWVSLLRLGLGFGAPLAIGGLPGVLGAILGDLIDRCEYYHELRIPTPAGAMIQAQSSSLI